MLNMWFPRKDDDRSSHTVREPFSPSQLRGMDDSTEDMDESGLLKTLGWVSAALGAVALGLIVGREIRQRYKFNRQTPYDLYAHSGDDVTDLSDVEFGVGI